MEKRCSKKKCHPPGKVNFSKRLHEKKVDPGDRVTLAVKFAYIPRLSLTRLLTLAPFKEALSLVKLE